MSHAGDDAEAALAEGFGAAGHPVHTRFFEVEVHAAEEGRIRASGSILDLRKHGFVPTGGDLQTSGIIHHMCLDAWVDPATGILEVLEPTQPVVAFEASPRTEGESCRDTAHRLRDLAGERLDDAFPRKLAGRFGGPLGCSHLLTLAHLLASTVRRAIALEAQLQAGGRAPRALDERIFKRSLVVDGLEGLEATGTARRMFLLVQQNDVHTAPFAEVEGPVDRFEHQHEVRVLAGVDLAAMTFASIAAAERARSRTELATARWVEVDETVAPLVGRSALAGLARALLEIFDADAAHPPLLDALLNMAPALIQCMAAMAHRMVEQHASGVEAPREQGPTILDLGGQADSCYIWRAGGPGLRLRPTREGGSS